MAISKRLKAFLESSNVKHTAAKHPVAYTAQEIAATQHVPGRQLAKCVLVKTDRGPVLAVLPAIHLIHLKRLRGLLGSRTLSIAKEADIKQHFPDVEVGAMSPFGHLYQIPVVVDWVLGESEHIVFNAGSHTDTIKMRYRDFANLVKPTVGAFGHPIGGPSAGARSRAKSARPKRPSSQHPSRVKASSRRPAPRARSTKRKSTR